MRRLALILLLSLAGCAALRPGASYVAPGISATDAKVLASDAVDYLAGALPAARTTVVLDAAPSDVLRPALIADLRATGFGVRPLDQSTQEARQSEGVPVRYVVSQLEGGVVMRLHYRGTEAARFYRRGNDGALSISGPFTVRETGQ